MRTGLTSAVPFSPGDQEQQDSSASGCAGCQSHPGSAAAGAATGRLAGLCQHEGGGLGWRVQIVCNMTERGGGMLGVLWAVAGEGTMYGIRVGTV